MEKKTLEIRISLLDEEQLERMIWSEPEKWGIKEELLSMCEGWADELDVEKVSDNEFKVSLTFDTDSDYCNVSSVITFNYLFYDDDVIDISDYLGYPEFKNIEEEEMFWEDFEEE